MEIGGTPEGFVTGIVVVASTVIGVAGIFGFKLRADTISGGGTSSRGSIGIATGWINGVTALEVISDHFGAIFGVNTGIFSVVLFKGVLEGFDVLATTRIAALALGGGEGNGGNSD